MRFANAVLGAMALLLSGLCAAQSGYSGVVAFGDSLSDNGNYYRLVDRLTPLAPQDGSPPLPYYYGRYSNGPVAVELLAAKLGVRLQNFAVGGALSGTGHIDPRFPRAGVLAQVQDFVARRGRLDDDALYVVWGGANDFLAANDLSDPAAVQTLVATTIGNLSQAIGLLYFRGARHFLVPNLPDLGLIPLEKDRSAQASQLSALFNQAFAQALQALEQKLDRAEIRPFDTAALLRTVAQSPGAYGFANVSDACVEDATFACILSSFNGGVAAGYLFWDDVHPSAKGHAVLAEQFLATVAPRGVVPPAEHEVGKTWHDRIRRRH